MYVRSVLKDQLLDCNRVLISELLNTPKPVFTPKRGLLDTDEQISRIIQDDSASFYRTKLRALISGKTDSVFTDFADNIESQIRNFKNEKNDRNDKKGDSDRKKSNFALIQRNNKSVRFSIVRSQRIPSTPSDMSGEKHFDHYIVVFYIIIISIYSFSHFICNS